MLVAGADCQADLGMGQRLHSNNPGDGGDHDHGGRVRDAGHRARSGWQWRAMPAFLALPGTAALGAAGATAGNRRTGAIGFGALAAGIGASCLSRPRWRPSSKTRASRSQVQATRHRGGQGAKRACREHGRTNAEFEKCEAMLIRQGVRLDRAALKEMDHAARSRTSTRRRRSTGPADRREIRAITGVAATRDQITGRSLPRGAHGKPGRGAALAVQGITEREIATAWPRAGRGTGRARRWTISGRRGPARKSGSM